MALTMWGQVIIQAATPGEDPVQVGTLWIDTSATATLKVCTAISPYTFAAISGGSVALDDLTDVVITAAASGDYLRFNGSNWVDVAASQLATDLNGLVAPSSHNHTSAADDGGVLTADEHDTFSDYSGTTLPATPAAGHVRLYAKTTQAHTCIHHVDENGTEYLTLQDSVILVRNTSGAEIAKGSAVDIYGATGQIANVRKAIANDTTKHAEGLLFHTVANNAFGCMMTQGVIKNIDTSAWTEGDQLYLTDVAGVLGTTPGTYTQGLAIVIHSHLTAGELFIYPDTMQLPHAAKHLSGGIDAIKLDDLAAPDDNTDLNASTTLHGLLLKATAPAAGLQNVVAIRNGETVYSNHALFDTTNPAALGTAAPGTSLIAARRDHVHEAPAAGVTQTEGSWTPTMAFGGSATGITYSVQTGYYIKTGKLVKVFGRITLTSNGSGAGVPTLTNLPFTIENNATGLNVGSCLMLAGGSGNFYGLALQGIVNTTTATFIAQGITNAVALTEANLTDSFSCDFDFTYKASA